METYKTGDSRIASGYTMGFGVADFETGVLTERLLIAQVNRSVISFPRALDISRSPSDWLYLHLVLRKPEEPDSTPPAGPVPKLKQASKPPRSPPVPRASPTQRNKAPRRTSWWEALLGV